MISFQRQSEKEEDIDEQMSTAPRYSKTREIFYSRKIFDDENLKRKAANVVSVIRSKVSLFVETRATGATRSKLALILFAEF